MTIQPVDKIKGSIRVPGDKSIAHRALILGTLARGTQEIEGLPDSADVRSTLECLRTLGAFIERMPDGRTLILSTDLGEGAWLDAGNSGTTARLLAGLLAARPLSATIDGDASLRRRPMARIAEPLARMGAGVSMADGGHLPMTIHGGKLKGITYPLPVASAQVKSAVLIAGLFADGPTTVVEGAPTRDHTERMLKAMLVPVHRDGGRITVEGHAELRAVRFQVPADISSAAYFMVAASCLPSSEVYLPTTGVNPTRTGILDVLGAMGARIERVHEEAFLEEPVCDIAVKSSLLRGVEVDPAVVPRVIDELPILAVAATQAEGETIVSGAAELRHKESDRIHAVVVNLRRMGADIDEREDGFIVRGPTKLRGARITSFGDHRIVMAMAVAGLLADGNTEIEEASAATVSYPGFFDDLRTLVH